jgi:hypothetical protein
VSLLPALRSLTGRAGHISVSWDASFRARRAICGYCHEETGVDQPGQLVRHGPLTAACPGGGDPVINPRIGPGNARACYRAAATVMAGRRRPRAKR